MSNGINFVAIGDWGGEGYSPFVTKPQVATSVGMGKVASAIKSDFVVALGDNFYSDGVTSHTSARFKDTWEGINFFAQLFLPKNYFYYLLLLLFIYHSYHTIIIIIIIIWVTIFG